jgi:hypothetical protein
MLVCSISYNIFQSLPPTGKSRRRGFLILEKVHNETVKPIEIESNALKSL